MKRTLLLLGVFAGLASANPLCLNDTIANYITNYTTIDNACQVGDKLFWAFNYSGTASHATAPTSAQVFVNGDPSNPNEPGLVFSSAGWTVSGNTSNAFSTFVDSNIRFTVATIGLNPLIIDGTLDFAGRFAVSGLGQALIGEALTPEGQPSLNLSVDSNAGPFTTTVNFAPVRAVTVSKDLIVRIPRTNTVGVFSTATITSFREGFSEIVPEPMTYMLFGSGLGVLALLRRRR